MGRVARVVMSLALCVTLVTAADGCGSRQGHQTAAFDTAIVKGVSISEKKPFRFTFRMTKTAGIRARVETTDSLPSAGLYAVKVATDGSTTKVAEVAHISMRRKGSIDTWTFDATGPLVPGWYELELRGPGQVIELEIRPN